MSVSIKAIKLKLIYLSPDIYVFEVKPNELICTSGNSDSEREDYTPEDWN